MLAKHKLFEALYADYHPMVLQMCLGFAKGDEDLANDLQQEIFINTWNALTKFKGKSGYKTWIYRITVNTCLKYIRDNKSKVQVTLKESDQHKILKEDEIDSSHQSLYQAIGRLNEVDRLIIMMVLDELTYDEIAAVIGISARNLRAKIHRIKQALKKYLKMDNTIQDLKNSWQSAKKDVKSRSNDATQIIAQAKNKMKQTLRFQLGNIMILSFSLLGIAAFFRYVAPFQQTLSHVSIALMLGGLLVRIIIELYSIALVSKIDFSHSTLITNEKLLSLHQFRKIVHGSITIIIIVLYSIGFYMLTPEFSLYFSKFMMILIDISYIPVAFIFSWFTIKAIRKEMRNLNEILRIQNELVSE